MQGMSSSALNTTQPFCERVIGKASKGSKYVTVAMRKEDGFAELARLCTRKENKYQQCGRIKCLCRQSG